MGRRGAEGGRRAQDDVLSLDRQDTNVSSSSERGGYGEMVDEVKGLVEMVQKIDVVETRI